MPLNLLFIGKQGSDKTSQNGRSSKQLEIIYSSKPYEFHTTPMKKFVAMRLDLGIAFALQATILPLLKRFFR